MKKFIIAAACMAAFLFSGNTASAQKFDFENPMAKEFETKAGRVDADLLGTYYFGFSTLTPSSSALGVNIGKSFSFGFNFGSVALNLDRAGNIQFTAALRWTFNNLVNANNYVYSNVNGYMAATPFVGADVTKSKIRLDYLGIPVGIRVNVERFKIFANVSAEVLTTAKRKFITNNGTTKENLSGVSQFRSCIEGGIGYGFLNAFVRYSLTPEFKDLSSNDYRPVTFGLALMF